VNGLLHFLTFLLPGKTPVGFSLGRTKDGKTSERPWMIAKENPMRYRGKVALLANRGSASASEIAAAALHESKRAVLLGRKTAGAVLTSRFVDVGEGFSLQIPIGDYKTAKGVRLEATGVKPDIELPAGASSPASFGQTDEGIEAARKALRGESKPIRKAR
jgi:carboxyl-terminal processing protease